MGSPPSRQADQQDQVLRTEKLLVLVLRADPSDPSSRLAKLDDVPLLGVSGQNAAEFWRVRADWWRRTLTHADPLKGLHALGSGGHAA